MAAEVLQFFDQDFSGNSNISGKYFFGLTIWDEDLQKTMVFRRSHVMNDPINFIDPNGLWSVTAGLFIGWGGSITIGQNPNGGYFGTVRGGVGVGGGGSWDPHGQSQDGGACSGVSVGTYAEGSAHFGPLEAVAGTSSGYSQSNGPYYNRPNVSADVVPSVGVGAGVSGGFEVTFH